MRLWLRKNPYMRSRIQCQRRTHGLYNMGNYINQSLTWYNTYGLNGNLIKILGAHSLKFGGEMRLMDQSSINQGGGPPALTATTPALRATSGPMS